MQHSPNVASQRSSVSWRCVFIPRLHLREVSSIPVFSCQGDVKWTGTVVYLLYSRRLIQFTASSCSDWVPPQTFFHYFHKGGTLLPFPVCWIPVQHKWSFSQQIILTWDHSKTMWRIETWLFFFLFHKKILPKPLLRLLFPRLKHSQWTLFSFLNK